MHPDKISAYLCYDPRDCSQSIDDRSSWRLSDNAILITATMLLAVDSECSRIDWERVATLADLCEDPEFCPTSCAQPPRPKRYASRRETDAMLRATLGIALR
jgi:hypothetical protein